MVISEQKRLDYIKRLLLSRMRILCEHGFYGLLLMHALFSIDDICDTACTNGTSISFNPDFLEELSDTELDFVMMHEVMHCVLEHVWRGEEYDNQLYNIAADIVVNSNILKESDMNIASISLHGQPLMHLAPDGKEGYMYTAEEVYEMLIKNAVVVKVGAPSNGEQGKKKRPSAGGDNNVEYVCGKIRYKIPFDDHSRWREAEGEAHDLWVKHFADACGSIQVSKSSPFCGGLPLFAQRQLKKLTKPQIDWRTILNGFVQEEVSDYSFSPPDRRYDFGFFLPDFSDKTAVVKDILFMIDTSGSMSDREVTAAYSEVRGAIDQFNGKLRGWLGYFEAGVVEPVPFEDVRDLTPPAGGGGTDFFVVFRYVRERMRNNPPASIIILTDGYAPFPPEEAAMGIPVLWLLTNNNVNPAWGRVARIKV